MGVEGGKRMLNGAAEKIVEREKLPESCLVGQPRFRRLKKV